MASAEHDLLRTTQLTCFPLALLIHTFLAFLILVKSPKSLGAYRFLLVYISAFELLYALLDVLFSPELFTAGSAFMLVIDSHNVPFVPFVTLYPILLLFCGMLGYSMAIFTITFIYRYLVVKGSHLLKSFDSPRHLMMWMVSPIPYGAVWMTVTAVTLNGNEYTDRVLEERFLAHPLHDVVYIGPNYYPHSGCIDWIPIVGMAVLTLMIFASIYSIVYFAAKSYLLMNALVSSSSSKASLRHKATQSQLLNALVLQALIPFLLMHLPASFVFIMPFFERGEQIFARIFSITVALYPVLDPLPTIFVVKYYRIAVFDYCSRIWMCLIRSKKSTAVVSEFHSSTVYQLSVSPA